MVTIFFDASKHLSDTAARSNGSWIFLSPLPQHAFLIFLR